MPSPNAVAISLFALASLALLGCESEQAKAEKTGRTHSTTAGSVVCLESKYAGGELKGSEKGGPCDSSNKIAECEDSNGVKYVFYKGADKEMIQRDCGPDVAIAE